MKVDLKKRLKRSRNIRKKFILIIRLSMMTKK